MEQKDSRFHLWLKNTFHRKSFPTFFWGAFLCVFYLTNVQTWLRSRKAASWGLIILLLAIAVIGILRNLRKEQKRPASQGGGWVVLGVLLSGLICLFLRYIQGPHLIGLLTVCAMILLLDYIRWAGEEA